MIANSPGPFAGIQDIGRPAPPSVHRASSRATAGDEAAQGRRNRAGSAVSSLAGRAAGTGRIAVVLRGPAPPSAVILADVQLEDGEVIEAEPAQRAGPDERG
jgi:hypothetical protein